MASHKPQQPDIEQTLEQPEKITDAQEFGFSKGSCVNRQIITLLGCKKVST